MRAAHSTRITTGNQSLQMDIIFLRDLRVDTLIGVYEWEKRVPQTLQIDLDIAVPDNLAAQTDDIKDALNYADIVRRIQAELAETIAQMLLNDFKTPWVKVSVAKLNAIRGSRMVGISIERGLPKA